MRAAGGLLLESRARPHGGRLVGWRGGPAHEYLLRVELGRRLGDEVEGQLRVGEVLRYRLVAEHVPPVSNRLLVVARVPGLTRRLVEVEQLGDVHDQLTEEHCPFSRLPARPEADGPAS